MTNVDEVRAPVTTPPDSRDEDQGLVVALIAARTCGAHLALSLGQWPTARRGPQQEFARIFGIGWRVIGNVAAELICAARRDHCVQSRPRFTDPGACGGTVCLAAHALAGPCRQPGGGVGMAQSVVTVVWRILKWSR